MTCNAIILQTRRDTGAISLTYNLKFTPLLCKLHENIPSCKSALKVALDIRVCYFKLVLK